MKFTRPAAFFAFLLCALSIAAQAPLPGGGAQAPGQGPVPSGGSRPGSPGQAAPGPGQGGAGRGGIVAAAREETRATFASAAGRLEPARRAAHSLSVGGFVEAVHVRVGERVREGQALLTVVRDAPGDAYRPVVVLARIGGVVAELPLQPGAEARAGSNAATVIDDSSFIIRASLSDRDAQRAAALAGPSLAARGADGERLSARLESVSAEPDYATGLFSALIRVPAQAGARLGMAVFVELPVASLRGVFIRRELVVRRFGRTLIWTVDAGDTLRLLPVTLGRAFGDEFIVSSGLVPGTRYLSRLSGKEAEGMALRELMAAVGGS